VYPVERGKLAANWAILHFPDQLAFNLGFRFGLDPLQLQYSSPQSLPVDDLHG
jgi:hypothetical protein